jgi:hypothetical protein
MQIVQSATVIKADVQARGARRTGVRMPLHMRRGGNHLTRGVNTCGKYNTVSNDRYRPAVCLYFNPVESLRRTRRLPA